MPTAVFRANKAAAFAKIIALLAQLGYLGDGHSSVTAARRKPRPFSSTA